MIYIYANLDWLFNRMGFWPLPLMVSQEANLRKDWSLTRTLPLWLAYGNASVRQAFIVAVGSLPGWTWQHHTHSLGTWASRDCNLAWPLHLALPTNAMMQGHSKMSTKQCTYLFMGKWTALPHLHGTKIGNGAKIRQCKWLEDQLASQNLSQTKWTNPPTHKAWLAQMKLTSEFLFTQLPEFCLSIRFVGGIGIHGQCQRASQGFPGPWASIQQLVSIQACSHWLGCPSNASCNSQVEEQT